MDVERIESCAHGPKGLSWTLGDSPGHVHLLNFDGFPGLGVKSLPHLMNPQMDGACGFYRHPEAEGAGRDHFVIRTKVR